MAMSMAKRFRDGKKQAERQVSARLVHDHDVMSNLARVTVSSSRKASILELDLLDRCLEEIDDMVTQDDWPFMPDDERRAYRYMLINEILEKAEEGGYVHHGQADHLILPEPLHSNLKHFSATFSLTPAEHEICALFLLAVISYEVQGLLEYAWKKNPFLRYQLVAVATSLPQEEVAACLHPTSPLVENKWLSINDEDVHVSISGPSMPRALAKHLMSPEFSMEHLLNEIAPVAPTSPLEIKDFGYVGGDVDLIVRTLEGFKSKAMAGFNILLHGLPGTGKSELSRVLAQETGLTLRVIGQSDSSGETPTPIERLRSLLWAIKLTALSHDSILVVEEADELLELRETKGSPAPSKFWLNRVLETNPVPTIFCANCIQFVDSAILSRMRFNVLFNTPSAAWRQKVWSKYSVGLLNLEQETLGLLAKKYPVTPRLIANAVSTAELSSSSGAPNLQDIERALQSTARLQGIRPKPMTTQPHIVPYSVDFTNTDHDLDSIVSFLKDWEPNRGGVSLCLYGAPGTGKSAYCRHLADAIGKECLVKKGSDLLSWYRGMTEANLAAAFEEARNDDAVLVIDEIDTFLQDRRNASKQYEISEVNEFLVQLESFEGIVTCTTNLIDNLDPAAKSRFLLTVKFEWLKAGQVVDIFTQTLARISSKTSPEISEDTLRTLRSLSNVAPRDVANAARRAAVFNKCVQETDLLDEIMRETESKDGHKNPIGFCPQTTK